MTAARAVRPDVRLGSWGHASAWIVRTIILATTAFALLDLSLLVSGLRH